MAAAQRPAPRAFGYLPDEPDGRDRAPLQVSAALGDSLPESCDISYLTPNGAQLDQGPLGSCVANALSYCFIQQNAQAGRRIDPVSRLFIYWHARNQHDATRVDSGTYIREAIKVSNKLGRVSERLYPYVTDDLDQPRPRFTRKPGPHVLIAAHDHRVAIYERIPDDPEQRRLQIMAALAKHDSDPVHRSVEIGTQVSWDFVHYDWHRTGPMRTFEAPTSNIAGGHAMALAGYDPDGVIVIQSWRDWGCQGFARLSWDYVLNPMTRDLWSIHVPKQVG